MARIENFDKMEDSTEVKPVVAFKSVRKRKNFRQRRGSDEEDRSGDKREGEEEDFDREALIETMEKQKLRQRSAGISNITLAVGRKVSKAEEMAAKDAEDPFKIKSGGLVDLHTARRRLDEENGVPSEGKGRNSDKLGASDDVVGTQFSKETKIRDEDEEMKKFIESEMEKRRGKAVNQEEVEENTYKSPEDKALLSLPEHLSKSTFKKNEEMLSSAMLSGIPEVDLGIEEKIRNIKATEEAKKLQRERAERATRPSKFVPTNMAVNFKQANRFSEGKEEDVSQAKRAKTESAAAAAATSDPSAVVTQRTVVVGDEPEERRVCANASGAALSDPTKATDDAALAKFKSNFAGGKRGFSVKR